MKVQQSVISQKVQQIKVLYDGACPTCIADRNRYQAWLKSAQNENCSHVLWLDLNQHAELLLTHKIEYQTAIAELHVIINDSLVVKSLDAYILLFKQVWWAKPLAWCLALPIIKPLITRYYHYRVNKRLKRTNRL